MTRRLSLFLTIIVLFIAGEIVLREALGFGDTVLVQADEDIEYLAQPNQERYRFGNRIHYNENSMRSDSLISGAVKILGLGDSVINGGALTNQEDIATNLLSVKLTEEYGENIQVLNISYKSWGPDNTYAYIDKYGDFEARLIFLVVSSHDAFDNMNFSSIVGKNRNYPVEQYSFAYNELISQYLFPRLQKFLKLQKRKKSDSPKVPAAEPSFNSGFQNLFTYTRKKNIPFLIYLHPEISEIKKGAYNNQGQLIIDFAQNNDIKLMKGIDRARESHYRDHIHLNKRGQKYLYNSLFPVLQEYINL